MTIQGTKLRENSENPKSFLSFFRERGKKVFSKGQLLFPVDFCDDGIVVAGSVAPVALHLNLLWAVFGR